MKAKKFNKLFTRQSKEEKCRKYLKFLYIKC